LQKGVEEIGVAELVVGVVVNILRHVTVDAVERVRIGLAAGATRQFAVPDSSEFVVLLPQIGLEDLEGCEKAQDGDIAFREPAAFAEIVGQACCGYPGEQCGPHESRTHQSTTQHRTTAGQMYEWLHDIHDIPLSDEIWELL
jgi:hypothetical protein